MSNNMKQFIAAVIVILAITTSYEIDYAAIRGSIVGLSVAFISITSREIGKSDES